MSDQMDKIFRKKLERYKAEVKPNIWEAIAADQARKRRNARMRKWAIFSGLFLFVAGLSYGAYTYFYASPYPSLDKTKISIPNTENADRVEVIQPKALPKPVDSKQSAQQLQSAAHVRQNMMFNKVANTVNNNDIAATQTNTSISVSSASTEFINGKGGRATSIERNDIVNPITTEVSDANLPINQQSASVAELARLPMPLLLVEKSILPQPQVSSISNVEGSHFKRTSKKRLSLDVLGGPAYANQSFKLADESNRNLLSARAISEFPAVSSLAAIRVSYSLKDRWSVRSGIQYTQIRNQFEYEQSGSTVGSNVLIKSNNRLQLLEIPMLFSYELPGKRFRLAINAGPVLNLTMRAKGRYLLPDLMQPINLEEDNIYRSQIGIAYQLSFSAAYDLGMGNSLLIEPTFKRYNQSFTKSTYALQEKYWLAALQIGLRHNLR